MAISKRRGAQPLSHILSEVMARRGLSRLRGQEELERAWCVALERTVGHPLADSTRIGCVRRGVLEVQVANSVLLQELGGFHKQRLLETLRKTVAFETIRDIRFRLDEHAGA